MSTVSPPVTSPATQDLIQTAHADGIRVYWRRLPGGLGHYSREHRAIWLDPDLTDIEARSLLAHELAHHQLGHDGPQPPHIEEKVWEHAALMLIRLGDYARAEQIHGWHSPGIAEELGVTREVVSAYRRILRRITP